MSHVDAVTNWTAFLPQTLEQQTLTVLQRIEGLLVRIHDVLLDKRDAQQPKPQQKGKK